jgi:hypothetical protein
MSCCHCKGYRKVRESERRVSECGLVQVHQSTCRRRHAAESSEGRGYDDGGDDHRRNGHGDHHDCCKD